MKGRKAPPPGPRRVAVDGSAVRLAFPSHQFRSPILPICVCLFTEHHIPIQQQSSGIFPASIPSSESPLQALALQDDGTRERFVSPTNSENGYLRFVVEAVNVALALMPGSCFRSRADAEAEIRRLGGLLAETITSATDIGAPPGPSPQAGFEVP